LGNFFRENAIAELEDGDELAKLNDRETEIKSTNP
jgi:hypothetical protein